MLSTGIDHIVNQVVNPRISTELKPDIDKVVCEYLGYDPEVWKKKIEYRENAKKRQMMEEQRQGGESCLSFSCTWLFVTVMYNTAT